MTLQSPCSQRPKHKQFLYLYFHCLAIWDFSMELKVMVIFFL